VSVADGGGQVRARRTPLVGAIGVARFLRGTLRSTVVKRAFADGGYALHAAVVNGGPAVLGVVGDRVVGVISFVLTSGGVAAIHIQANPDKLERLTRRWAATEHGEPLVADW
jgi:RNA polymerase sigma-70 factor (ECF subfamily)